MKPLLPLLQYFYGASFAVGLDRGRQKHTLHQAESRAGFIIFYFLFSVKWLVMFYYTCNNEEDLYIHSQDPFRNKKKKKQILYYTAPTRLKHTQRVGEVDTTHHTCRLLENGCLKQHKWECWTFLQLTENFQLAHSQVKTYNFVKTELETEHLFEIVLVFFCLYYYPQKKHSTSFLVVRRKGTCCWAEFFFCEFLS